MADVLALISRAQFDEAFANAHPGQTLPIDRYDSSARGLTPLSSGGSLFLVTVRPPDESLWLVAVLDHPVFDGTRWTAAPNTEPIAPLDDVRDGFRFSTGKGLSTRTGALGMSLQTPRVLTPGDVALIRTACTAARESAERRVAIARLTTEARRRQQAAPEAPAPSDGTPEAGPGRDCLLLALTSPIEAGKSDVFCARSRTAAARWLAWAVSTQRGVEAAQSLTDLALRGALQLQCWKVVDGQLGPARDLTRLLMLSIEDELEVAVGSSGVPALARRLARHEDEEAELSVPAASLESELSELAHPLAHGVSIPLEGGPVDRAELGAFLADGTFPDFDPDPPPPRVVALPAAAEALFRRVYEAPDDEPARAVLADALEEAGHPRGRFISLQLARAQSGGEPSFEEEELLRRHGAEWLGDLVQMFVGPSQDPSAIRGSARVFTQWERGFLHALSGFDAYPALLRRPELSTVRWIDCGYAPARACLDGLGRLEVLRGASEVWLRELLQHDLPHLRELELTWPQGWNAVFDWDHDELHELCDGTRLGSLRRFFAPDPGEGSWFWGSPLAKRLTCFGTTVNGQPLEDWLRRLGALPVPEVELTTGYFVLRLVRGESIADLRVAPLIDAGTLDVVRALEATRTRLVEAGTVTGLRVGLESPTERVLEFARSSSLPIEVVGRPRPVRSARWPAGV